MKLPKDQPFWTSVILHGAVLLALFLATIIEYFRPDEEAVHVFEMVSDVAPSPSQSQPVTSAEPPPPDIQMPDLAPVPVVPDVQVPPPQVTPPPTPSPTPPKPKPKKPQMMSYEEFLKHNKIREPRQQQRPSRPVTTAPTISIPQVDVPTITHSPQSSRPTAAQVSALNNYNMQLRNRLMQAWRKPTNLGGLELRVNVSFYVSASGHISKVKLNPPTGNATFDQSVLSAFRAMGSAGPTPTGQGFSSSINFRMEL